MSSGHSGGGGGGSTVGLNTIAPGISGSSTAISAENHNILLLFYLGQLFLRELFKSYRLIQVVPMDMSGYYGRCCVWPLFAISACNIWNVLGNHFWL